ncbi:MAG: hypothetical protein WD042_08680 [Phycisphaeraceae bacterium]
MVRNASPVQDCHGQPEPAAEGVRTHDRALDDASAAPGGDRVRIDAAVTVPSGKSTGLSFQVAGSLEEVIDAWRLVYHAYRRIDIIPANPFEVHTVRQAARGSSAVVLGLLGPQVISTLTCMLDGQQGLPLDLVYRKELEALRQRGRRLCEIGLFADRREHLARSLVSLFGLMRIGIYYAVATGCDDIVIGVHPHHAPFYRRALAFELIGELDTHPTVCDAPVVLLRMDLAKLLLPNKPRGLAFVTESPVPASLYADRFTFDPRLVTGSAVDQYLRAKAQPISPILSEQS